MTPDDHHKRAVPRFVSVIHAKLHVGGQTHECRAANLSRQGVLVRGRFPGGSADRVEVTLSDPSGRLEVRLPARVAWTRSRPKSEAALGLVFEPLDADLGARLETLVGRVLEGRTLVPLDDLPDDAPALEVRSALERVPLAKRIALASRAQARERRFLLHDKSPQVLEALTRNPHLKQSEARALAKVPHLLTGTLERLARDERWSDDEDIRLAVAVHPRVPMPLAEKLLAGLGPVALRKALTTPSLKDPMRRKILYRLSHLG